MQPDRHSTNVALRLYSLVGSCLVLAFLPGFLYKIGTHRRPPVQLDKIPRLDGSLGGRVVAENRTGRFSEVSMDNGPFVPAGGVAVARDYRCLPPGTPISLREVGTGQASVLSGTVEVLRSPPDRVALDLILGLLGVVFCVAGAGVALAGANRQALFAAALLSGSGHLLAYPFLQPNASMLTDRGLRYAVELLWSAFPGNLAYLWLVSFISLFPLNVWESGLSRIARFTTAALAILEVVLENLVGIPGAVDRFPTPTQAAIVGGGLRVPELLLVLGFGAALGLALLQVRQYRRQRMATETRRRAGIVGVAFLAGIVPTLLVAIVQALFLAFRGRPLVSSLVMALFFTPILLIPPTLAYAVLASRVQSVGILVRKAVLFGFAEKTVRVLALVPLAWLAVFLYSNRQSRLDELLEARPAALLGAAFAAVLGLVYGDRARAALEKLFFRRKVAAARILRDLAEKAREARNVAELGSLLTTETDAALGLESIALFVREEGSDSYSCDGRDLPALEGASVVVEAASRARGPLRVELDDPGSPLRGLPELDRQWIEATDARLLVPLTGSDGHLLALLVLGEKRSELPFDREDEQLLAATAASGALALENQMLRSSGGERGSRDGTDLSPAAPDMDVGLFCRTCSRVLAPGIGALCPDDESRLEPAAVPYLLAGKYRFEKRIGSGGMGIVYRARDVSLSRDVAIKILPRVSRQGVRRLRREARAAARLIHPNLGLIFAAETWRGTPLLVLEFLDGGTLDDRIACGPIEPFDVVDWGIRLAGALEAAHAQAILHRDIKPSNVGFTTGGVPKLLDFGLVRLLDDPAAFGADEAPLASREPLDSVASGGFPLTACGRVVGTAPYLSPEAVQGLPPTPAFDVWGLTLTLYEALTGHNPFAVAPTEKAFNLILTTSAPDPRTFRPDCPEPVARFFPEALSRSAQARPATARELRARLETLRA